MRAATVTQTMPIRVPAAEKARASHARWPWRHKVSVDAGPGRSCVDGGARAAGRVSRERITQITNLLMLAPEIQEEILFGERRGPTAEPDSVDAFGGLERAESSMRSEEDSVVNDQSCPENVLRA